jgi:PAS domain S-box-containing protein
MGKPLRVLIVEDSEDDMQLMLRELRQGGYDPTYERVETPQTMRAALDQQTWDIVLSDYVMPQFSGLAALKLFRERGLDLPFIIVSGHIGEDLAIEAMRAGVHDYLLKDRLGRLGPAVERELFEAEVRREHRQMEKRLEHLNAVLRAIRNVSQLIIQEKDRDRLLQRVCAILLETRDYRSIWVVLWNEAVGLVASAEAGLGTDFPPLLELFRQQAWPACVRQASVQPGPVLTGEPALTCDGCPLFGKDPDRGGITIRLEHGGQIYGFLGISTSVDSLLDKEECSLMQEMAGDIAFALHGMELEEAHRRAEDALVEERNRLRALIDNSLDLIYIKDVESRFVIGNPAVARIMGVAAPDELVGKTDFDFYPRELAERLYADEEEIIRSGQAMVDQEESVSDPEGHPRWVSSTKVPLRDSQGKIMGLVGVGRDITERKWAEETLRQYEYIVSSSADMMALLDERFTYLSANPAYAKAFNKTPDEIIGHTVSDVFGEEFFDNVIKPNAQRCLRGEFVTYDEWFDIPAYGQRYMEINYYPYADVDNEIKGFVLNGRNITERQQTEQKLIHLERLRAVGELSAGISHNLNNILTTVIGPAQLIKRKTDDPNLLSEMDTIILSAERARDLVHKLHLSVRTRDEEELLRPVCIDQVVQQAVQAARPCWKDEPEARGIAIDVVTRWGDVPSIQGAEADLHDIFTNFIFNAVDAMPKGGTITIETETIEDQVQITFSDTGIGMGEATRLRIFEPFFTTKMDLGTGLGLSTVHNTVTRWGGTIEVGSTPGEGTAFTLRFPVWRGEIVAEKRKTTVQPTRSGKIFVIDDDEAICDLLSRLLEEHHEVETTTDGRQALAQFAPGKYDVAVIDLGMSGMAGDQLMRQIKDIDPQVTTVLITGWSLPDTDTRVSSFDFRIVKPFTDLDEVENVVARAIELHDERVEEIN